MMAMALFPLDHTQLPRQIDYISREQADERNSWVPRWKY